MKIQILETVAMREARPAGINELFRANDVDVISRGKIGSDITYGDQVLLEADAKTFKAWLLPFEKVWFNFGAMQLEQFELMDMKDFIDE